MKRWPAVLAALASLAVLAGGVVAWGDRATPIAPDARPAEGTPAQVARGAQLARVGNCAVCHTSRGGAPYAGGRGVGTPFGTVYAGNLTPDAATGLGRWSADHFWRAMHHGRGFDSRRLVPVFPYPQFTLVTRQDSDALYAFLRTLPPVTQPNRAHELRFPFDTDAALTVWRVLFFEPGVWQDDARRSAEWNRGAYLVNGIGHCVACHGERNAFGANTGAGFGGGRVASSAWYAPSLTRADEAGVADWPLDDIFVLLRDGLAPRGRVSGPMAEVVLHGTQHLHTDDLRSIATYLQSLPPRPVRPPAVQAPPATQRALGAALYDEHCVACHGTQGEGGVTADGRSVVPALAGNRLVTMEPATNLVRSIALGGFGPATAGNPRPFGMPPFEQVLDDAGIAALATFLRSSWGAQASPLNASDVARHRGGD